MLVATVLSLLLCELVARLIFPPVRGVHWYHYDPRYVMRHRSNMAAVTTEWGDGKRWFFRTNARGFRGDEWSPPPPPHTRRALVMGDSFTFGDGIDEGGAFPQLADRWLPDDPAGGERWQVLDLGVSAWGPQNALGYLETEGSDIGASCLIYAFFLGNDVMDNVNAGLYGLRDGRLARNPVAPPRSRLGSMIRSIVISMPFYDFLLAHSELVNLVRTAVIDAFAEDYTVVERTSVPADVYGRALDLNDATLARMQALAQRRFGDFAIVIIPPLDELLTRRKPVFSPALADQARSRVRAWAAAHEVPTLDLLDLLPHGAAAETFYFHRDFHMNAAGHRLLGEALARSMPRLCPGQPS